MEETGVETQKAAASFEARCGRIFLRVMIVILPLLIFDYVSSFFWSHHRSDIERKFSVAVERHPKPYVMFGGVKNGAISESEQLNDLGYRGAAPSNPKPLNEFRIFMLGGSTVFAGEPPIAVLLEEEFRKNGRENVKVYNFGVVSSVSGMELARILFEISDFQPDLIIFYNGSNDILLPLMRDPRPGYPFNFIVYENNPLLESEVRSYPGYSLLLYGSNLARYFLHKYFMWRFIPLEQERQKVGWGTDEWKDAIARDYINNMVKAKKISNAFGSQFIGFLQPMVYYKDTLAEEEKTESFRPQRKDHCIDIRERIRQQIEELAGDNVPKIIDLSDIYDDTEIQVFNDYTHTNQRGKVIVAKAIYRHLVDIFTIM
jgi:hypothetical protein